MNSYMQRSKRSKNNKRLSIRRKQKHVDKCNKFLLEREQYLNGLLFETWEGQVKKELKFEECKINYILQKERLIKDLKNQKILIDLAKKDMVEPYEFVNFTKFDIPPLTWIEYFFGYKKTVDII